MRIRPSAPARFAALLAGTLALFGPACAARAPKPPASAGAGATYDPELSGYAYPRPVRFFSFRSQRLGLRMAYLDAEPERPNGRTALLLHGKNFSAAYWEPTLRALLRRGFRVIAPDQVGFGKSSKPVSYRYSFHALAENTRDLLDHLGVDRVSVVGHSMGGMLAVRFSRMFPARVEKLALVNPIGLEDYAELVPYEGVEAYYAAELRQTPESIRAYQRKNYYAGAWKPEYERLIEPLAGWTRHPEYPRIAWVSAQTYDMIFTEPVVHELPRLAVPTLLVIGQRDRTALGRQSAPPEVAERMGDYPRLGRRAARAIPNARLVELGGVGHLPQVEAFGPYVAALTSFLEAPVDEARRP